MSRLLWLITMIIATGLLVILALWIEGFEQKLEVQQEAEVATGRFENLWFTEDNRLVGVRRAGTGVELEVWSGGADPSQRQKLTAVAQGEASAEPVYGISDDGAWVAWVDGKRLYQRSLSRLYGGERTGVDLHRAEGILTLAVLSPARVLIGYADGTYSIVDSKSGQSVSSGDTEIDDPAPFAIGGSFLATYSRTLQEIRLLDGRRNDGVSIAERRRSRSAIDRLAVSRAGKLLVINSEGRVIHWKDANDVPGSLPAPGRVRVLASVDNVRWVAAGDFRGIYELAPDAEPLQLVPGDFGSTRLLAATDVQIASHTGERTAVYGRHMTTVYRKEISWIPVTWVLLVIAAVIGDQIGSRLWAIILRLLKRLKLTKKKDPVLPVPAVPPALIDAIFAGNCYLHAGSGLSAQAGLPPWREFLKQLLDWAVESRILNPNQQLSLNSQLVDGPIEGVAERIADAMGDRRSGVRQLLSRAYRMTAAELSPAHHNLSSLPFAGGLTTNPDEALEFTFAGRRGPVLTPDDGEMIREGVRRKEFFILKLYGVLSQPDTLRLGVAEYGRSLMCNYDFQEAMNEMFMKRNIFFIGASMEGLAMDLRNIVFERSAPQRHFALVPVTGEAWEAQAQGLEERWGIRVLPYTASLPTHPEVDQFLQALGEAAKMRTTAASA